MSKGERRGSNISTGSLQGEAGIEQCQVENEEDPIGVLVLCKERQVLNNVR